MGWHNVVRLNLTTLCWGHVRFSNAPPSRLPRTYFENGAPHAGIVVGAGGRQTPPIARLVVFRLKNPAMDDQVISEEDQEDEQEEEPNIVVQVLGPQGPRVLRMPLSTAMDLENELQEMPSELREIRLAEIIAQLQQ